MGLSEITVLPDGSTTVTPRLPSSKPSWQPHSYQRTGIIHLLGVAGAALFYDPGLGKTSICLATFKILKGEGLAKKVLVVVPLLPMLTSWGGEIEKWAEFEGLTYTVLHGKNKRANLQLDVDIYLINPEGLLWLFQEPLPVFDILIVDESTKFKRGNTERFKLLKKNLHLFHRRWILTGTPVPNGMFDLWGQVYILDLGGALGRYVTHYKNKYFHPKSVFEPHTSVLNQGAYEEIIERLRPMVSRAKAEDWLQMPELMYIDRKVKLPKNIMKIYKELENEFFTMLSEELVVTVANAAVAGVKCRQIVNGAMYIEGVPHEFHSAKLDALEDLLEELGPKPVLVLYEFNHDRDRILARFKEDKDSGAMRVLAGGAGAKRVEEVVSGFNAGTITRVLGHPESMGFGLNLQGACHHVIFFGLTWRLDLYQQAIARVYRQGQTAATVFVYHILAEETVDDRVSARLCQKNADQQAVLAALTAV
jgi:SNF2 family DNA or RNA helicase